MLTDPVQPVLDAPEIISLLDEHHLVVVGRGPDMRSRLARTLETTLDAQPGAEVVRIDGAAVTTLDRFLLAFEDAQGLAHRAPRTLDGLSDLLRRSSERTRRQYFLWNHADVCLESDVALFAELVTALIGIAAEREHLDSDSLVLQRTVFLGGDKLGACADDDDGPLAVWPDAQRTDRAMPVRPRVLTYRLDG